ncbi:MAG: thiamine pyrophosphate-binding protein [Candidatus Rokubacteria bacterium]|nr:thiamine pyrophosphate-binding protein [Candidatus Rokubacteria bacterium]
MSCQGSTVLGASLVVDALVGAGVSHVFSLSGNQILSVYDATIGRGVRLIHTRHEAAAVHMADAWGRLTERPGVALVTAGPGHLNAVGALYTALMAESPVVLLSGHAPRAQRGRGAFQEIDQAAVARPVTKASWVVESAERLGVDVTEALRLAASGRPGPVHLSLPGDLLETRVDAPAPRPAPPLPPPAIDASRIDIALDLLAKAERPLILSGPAMGRAHRRAAVERLASATGIPALVIESPRGVHDPALRGAAAALAATDMVLLLGKPLDFSLRFGEAFARGCRVVSAGEPGARGDRVTVALDGDTTAVAGALAAGAPGRAWGAEAWRDEVERLRSTVPPAWREARASPRAPMHPLRVCAALERPIADGAIFVGDGGEFGQWAQAGLEAECRLINGLSGSIGSAIPMALGAAVARPDRRVLAVLGDGTFGFHPLEFDTAVRHGLPVVVVVGNDARWNAEHQLQLKHYGVDRAIACDLLPSRYDRVVEALGGHGEHVERPEQLEPALARAFASGKPACVNVIIDGVAAPSF